MQVQCHRRTHRRALSPTCTSSVLRTNSIYNPSCWHTLSSRRIYALITETRNDTKFWWGVSRKTDNRFQDKINYEKNTRTLVHRVMAVTTNGLCWIQLAHNCVHCRTSVLIRRLFNNVPSTACGTASNVKRPTLKA
jgi:hypothetical protein